MKLILLLIVASSTFGQISPSMLNQFVGNYSYYTSYLEDNSNECPSELSAFYWTKSGLLDFQMYNPEDGEHFVEIDPLERDYLENSHALDTKSRKDFINENGIYKTQTYMRASNMITESTQKKLLRVRFLEHVNI